MVIPVLLSGGSGSRLWPLSRKMYPKQLMPMLGDELSLLQVTALRAAEATGSPSSIVVTNEEYRFTVASQLQEQGMEPQSIILEPVGRNTAPAVAVAAIQALTIEEDPTLLVLPADHYIKDTAAFSEVVAAGIHSAEQGKLVTFGIVPEKPETGFGYIRKGEAVSGSGSFVVDSFVEKPSSEVAQQYLDSGDYLWNSGMFMFKASVFLAELEKYAPEILTACRASLSTSVADLDFLRLNAEAFALCPSDSIDYAVMEHTDKAVVLPLSCGWSDVGSWSALHEVRDRDENENVCIGDVMMQGAENCYLHSTNRLVAVVGLENTAIVETKDAILAAPLDRVQEVKQIVGALDTKGRSEALSHTKVFRPWGNYESIDDGKGYQVKRITVYPGQTLSLQKHFHRAEHWIVVRGTALVTRGDEELVLSENESTYIPLGVVHRLENPGKLNLELIEVQSGSYLGEDDIVRLDDVYGRTGTAPKANC